jgi:hypothetical protein
MPNELYLIRLIHNLNRRAFPGERLWTADQLASTATIRFLRARNCEGCDVYIQAYSGNQNAGYIFIDLDGTRPSVITDMCANGHDPCVVLQTSPGHLQAWIRLSVLPLEPAVATAAGKWLARTYGGDPASTDWRHLGRLAGFTNQKPSRRTLAGYAPWVKVVSSRAGLAPRAEALLEAARAMATPDCWPVSTIKPTGPDTGPPGIGASAATKIYRGCVERWRIHERFPQPDWSIVDLWVARYLLGQGSAPAQVQEILRLASPHFPRRHADPGDYLRRTIAHAVFPRSPRPVCPDHTRASNLADTVKVRSNSLGGR